MTVPITAAEWMLLRQLQQGSSTNLAQGRPVDPGLGHTWGDERILRGEFLADLCQNDSWPATGIQVRGARVTGKFRLVGTSFSLPLALHGCHFCEPIELVFCDLLFVSLTGSHCVGLNADFTRIRGSLLLEQMQSGATISLNGAEIGGQVALSGTTVLAPHAKRSFEAEPLRPPSRRHRAVSAEGVRVAGSIHLGAGFRAHGLVSLMSAKIGGGLACAGGRFFGVPTPAEGRRALAADGAQVGQTVHLSYGFRAHGEVHLRCARIEGQLVAAGGWFVNPGHPCLSIAEAAIGRSLTLADARCSGSIEAGQLEVAGQADFDGAWLSAPRAVALMLDGARIGSTLHLGRDRGCRVRGCVSLIRASVGDQLLCRGTKMTDPNKEQVTAANDSARVDSLNADGISVMGDVQLSGGFSAEGRVRFPGAHIRGQLNCRDIEITVPDRWALHLEAARVDGPLLLRRFRKALPSLNLSEVATPLFVDDETAWPEAGSLVLSGLQIGKLGERSPQGVLQRLDWLDRQPGYNAETYAQLGEVFRRMGLGESAVQVAIAGEERRVEDARRRGHCKLGKRFLGATVRYGYRPFRVLKFIGALLLLGAICFGLAAEGAQEVSSPRVEIPRGPCSVETVVTRTFWTTLAAADALLPVPMNVELPRSGETTFGRLAGAMDPILRLAGWVLSAVFLAAVTGLVKQE